MILDSQRLEDLPRWKCSFGILVFGFALWLLTHPYVGIWHDARLYCLMAMHYLMPDAYALDPWFKFGSQDAYSVFSPIFALAVRQWGVADAAKWFSLLGGGLFVLATLSLTRAANYGRYSELAFLLLVSVPLGYCPNSIGILNLTESFATSRPFSEALSLTALALQLLRPSYAAWVLHGVALVVHPLMAISAVAVAIGARLPPKSVLVGVLACPLILALGVAINIPALLAMNESWRILAAETSAVVVFPGPSHDVSLALTASSVLLMAARYGKETMKNWYAMAVIVGMLGYAASMVAGMYYPSTLIMQVQPWRALWVTLVFAVLAACDLASGFFRGTTARRSGLLVGAGALLLIETFGAYVLVAMMLTLNIAGKKVALWINRHLTPRAWKLLLAIFTTVVVSQLFNLWQTMLITGGTQVLKARSPLEEFVRGVILTGGVGAVAGIFWAGLIFLSERRRLAVALLTLLMAALCWDQRRTEVVQLESNYKAGTHPAYFGNSIRPGEVVYWRGGAERVWFELKTASYASGVQAVGIVFSEPFAMEMQRRLSRVAQIGLPDSTFLDARVSDALRLQLALSRTGQVGSMNLHHWELPVFGGASDLSRVSLGYICADSALDWVVDPATFPDLATATETIEVAGFGDVLFALYSCKHLRDNHEIDQKKSSYSSTRDIGSMSLNSFISTSSSHPFL